MVIPRDKYIFSPSTKTIQLLDQYNLYTIERIRSIYNLQKQIEIYNYKNPCKNNSLKNISEMDISVSNGVITYNNTASMSASDALYIEIDTAVVTSMGGGGGSSPTITIDPINILYNQTIAANNTLDTVGVLTTNCTKLNVYISNTGTSTNVDIAVKGSPTSNLLLSKVIGDIVKLGANASNGPTIGNDEIPGYTWFSIKNNDPLNSAIITIAIDRYVGSYTQTNTTLLSNEEVISGTPKTSGDVYTSAARRVNIYCSQTGTSTNTIFDVYGKSNLSPNIPKLLATCTLGANKQWGCGILEDVIPGSIYTKITNSDSVRHSLATILVEAFT